MPRRDTPLSIEIPPPEADKPAWGKVGIIAAAGFALGIVWPRLTSTRIAPNPPNDNGGGTSAAVMGPVAGSGSSALPLAPAPVLAPSAIAAPAKPADSELPVSSGAIVTCRDGNDQKLRECGVLEFDPVAVPKIKGLSQCPAAKELSGKLSIGFDVDFKRKTVAVLLGKSTTLPRDKAEALVKCAASAFDKVSIAEVPHEHRRYTLFYTASFAPPNSGAPSNEKPSVEGPVAGSTSSESPASGSANVGWDVAIVRASPKTGTIVGRVLRGSKVKVVAHQGEWYKIQYGSIEGWVYRGTIGL